MNDINVILKEWKNKKILNDYFLPSGNLSFYLGFDLTHEDIHIGSYFMLERLKDLSKYGDLYILMGDFTSVIGDPTGRLQRRNDYDVNSNLMYILRAIKTFFNLHDIRNVHYVYNGHWLKNYGLADLIGVLQAFSLNDFLKRDTVKKRFREGKIFHMDELLYTFLQGIDFMNLYEQKGVNVQIGGSDQRTNILMGYDMINRKHKMSTGMILFDLLTKSDGNKFSKSDKSSMFLFYKSSNLIMDNMSKLEDETFVKILRLWDMYHIHDFYGVSFLAKTLFAKYLILKYKGLNGIYEIYFHRCDGERFLDVIRNRFAISKKDVLKNLERKVILVNGDIIKNPYLLLKKGDIISYSRNNNFIVS